MFKICNQILYNTNRVSFLQRSHHHSFIKLIPEVHVPKEHYRKSSLILKSIKPNAKILNIRNRQQNHIVISIDALIKSLTMPITRIINSYKLILDYCYDKSNAKNCNIVMHPFEKAVIQLTFLSNVKAGKPNIEEVIQQCRRLIKVTNQIGQKYIKLSKHKSLNSNDLKHVLYLAENELRVLYDYDTKVMLSNNSLITIQKLLDQLNPTDSNPMENIEDISKCLLDVLYISKQVRKIPVISLHTPTVILVGCPNVGKSSIVRCISTGIPEVNNYAFTTRGVTVGHIIDKESGLKIQVMDTPGLLDRSIAQRNEIEHLTYATLAHITDAVIVFVMDPTELSGIKTSSIINQLNVRSYLKSTFGDRDFIDVITKADLLCQDDQQEVWDHFVEIVEEYNRKASTERMCGDTMNRINDEYVKYPYQDILRVTSVVDAKLRNGLRDLSTSIKHVFSQTTS